METRHPGAGTILDRSLRRIGLTPRPACTWNDLVHSMNLKGPDWCQEFYLVILEKIGKCLKKQPWDEEGARRILDLAIEHARRV